MKGETAIFLPGLLRVDGSAVMSAAFYIVIDPLSLVGGQDLCGQGIDKELLHIAGISPGPLSGSNGPKFCYSYNAHANSICTD
jgi:hypothetical protein